MTLGKRCRRTEELPTERKLAIFDVTVKILVPAEMTQDGLREAANMTGSMVHSNSWRGENDCTVGGTLMRLDIYMNEVTAQIVFFWGLYCLSSTNRGSSAM